MRRAYLPVLLQALSIVTAACDRSGASRVDLSALVPAGSVQAVIQQAGAPKSDGTTTFVVRLVANGVSVSSYQGTVTFTPHLLDLVSLKPAPDKNGETHVVNAEAFGDGMIRFAAFTTAMFAGVGAGEGVEAFRFTAKSVRPLDEAKLVARLDVVGTDAGVPVPPDHLIASSGVMDAAGQLITASPPPSGAVP